MKLKKETIILAVVIVALVAYLVLRKQDRSLYDLPEIASVEAKDITRVELKKGDDSVTFRKEGSDWKIVPASYPADPVKVKDMLDVVKELTLTELISESKNYQRYDLDDKDGIHLKCWAMDSMVFELFIGKAAESFNHTFVKLPGNQAVYHAKGNFRNKFDKEMDDFREKTVLAFDTETIGAIFIETGEETASYNKLKAQAAQPDNKDAQESAPTGAVSKPKWKDAGGAEADADKIKNLISTLSDLKCEKFFKGKSKDDLSDPVYTITLTGAKAYTLTLFNEIKEGEDSFFPAVSSENDYPFLLTQWRSENIMKKPTELVKKSDQAVQ